MIMKYLIVREEMSSSSRLPCDPHAARRRTKQKAPAASAAAAQLLRLRRGGRAAAMDESIEFFSALRLRECHCQPDPARVSSQTGIVGPDDRRREKASRRSSGDDSGLLSTEIGKHDYDWLLTPPATSGTTAALNRLTRATSASYAKTKSNSPLALAHRRPENGSPTSSRLARSSSATHSSLQVMNTPEFASSSSRPPHLRTLSSSIKDASNASGPLGSVAWSARPASSPSRRPHSKLAQQVSSGSGAASQQPRGRSSSSNSGPTAPTTARQPRAPTNGPSSGPKSTCRVASASAARSRFASQLMSSAMSTAQPAQNVVVRSTKLRQPVTAAVTVRQCHGSGTAAAMSNNAASSTTQSWRSSPFPSQSSAAAISASASLSASRGDLSGSKRPSWSGGDYGRKINADKVTTPRRTAGLPSAATSSGLTRTSSQKSTNADAKATQKDLTLTSVARLLIARGCRARTQKGKATVAAAAAAAADAFPSTRYDTMLLREDPKNLTWLNGCGDDDGAEGVGLVEGSLEPEPFNVPVTGTNGTAA